MKKDFVRKINLPRHPLKVMLSEKRAKKYYEKGKKAKEIPKKYSDTTKFDYRPHKVSGRVRYFLTDLETGLRVIANPKAAGTPREVAINTQALYNGGWDEFTRNKVMSTLKRFYETRIEDRTPITGSPLYIEFIFYRPEEYFDIDNMSWVYIKAFHDWLKASGIITDDDNKIIRKYSGEYIPVDSMGERGMVIKIWTIDKKHRRK